MVLLDDLGEIIIDKFVVNFFKSFGVDLSCVSEFNLKRDVVLDGECDLKDEEFGGSDKVDIEIVKVPSLICLLVVDEVMGGGSNIVLRGESYQFY